MEKFKKFLVEKDIFFFKYDKIKVFFSSHAYERKDERHAIIDRLKEIIKEFLSKGFEIGKKYLIYSKKFKRGVVVDFINSTKIRIITILPKFHDTVKDGTEKVIVEELEKENLENIKIVILD